MNASPPIPASFDKLRNGIRYWQPPITASPAVKTFPNKHLHIYKVKSKENGVRMYRIPLRQIHCVSLEGKKEECEQRGCFWRGRQGLQPLGRGSSRDGQAGRKAADDSQEGSTKGSPVGRTELPNRRLPEIRTIVRDSFHLQISDDTARRPPITKRRSVFGNIELK
ncbi:hypothetical protein CDAR_432241 [Caerostris darwini]|uniref:Uncharacterized protein n=1 Tax=Caerostris darwini TaxID=1538125 RepID=A0AAV4U2W2_9ARAC|nr:hypothetical protein CDAR_432241 [Caerostris darwini]